MKRGVWGALVALQPSRSGEVDNGKRVQKFKPNRAP